MNLLKDSLQDCIKVFLHLRASLRQKLKRAKLTVTLHCFIETALITVAISILLPLLWVLPNKVRICRINVVVNSDQPLIYTDKKLLVH